MSKQLVNVFSKLARNAILVGQLNSYCLVCACHFDTEGGAHDHVLESKHISNLRGARYCETLRKDYIRQVKDGYFCGMCNTLLPTSTHVKLHVLKATHAENRGTLLLDRASSSNADGVLAFGCFQVSDDAWHGLIDETCVICNAEFEDKDTHKKELTHLLKLVQNNVELGDEQTVYRKIDDDSFQCLTCNIVFSAELFHEHFGGNEHIETHKQSKIDKATESDEVVYPREESISAEEALDSLLPTRRRRRYPKIHIGNTAEEDEAIFKVIGATNFIIDLDNDLGLFCILCHFPLKDFQTREEHLNSSHHKIMFRMHRRYEMDPDMITERKRDNEPDGNSGTIPKTKTGTEKPTKIVSTGTPTTKYDTEELTLTKKDIKEVSITKNDTAEPITTKKYTKAAAKTNNDTAEPTAKKDTKEATKTKTDTISIDRCLIVDSVNRFQKNEISINLINDTAFCKKCTVNVDFVYNSINKHIDDHIKKANKKADKKVNFDHGAKANGGNTNLFTKPVFKTQNEESTPTASVEDIRAVAKKHGMMYNGKELHCTTCDSTLPVGLKNIEEHVSGNKHKAKKSKPAIKPKEKKVRRESLEKFVKDVSLIDNEYCKDIVLNEKICIPHFNFMLLGKTLSEYACIACNMKLSSLKEMVEHIQDARHKKALKEADIITSYENEFVREIKSGIYHCGFCNDVSSSLENLEDHLKSAEHRRCKTQAEWRLQEHISEIRIHKVRKQFEFEMFARMFAMNAFMPNNVFNNNHFDSDSSD